MMTDWREYFLNHTARRAKEGLLWSHMQILPDGGMRIMYETIAERERRNRGKFG